MFVAHWLGVDNVSGYVYAFWSGFAGCLPMFGAWYVLARKHNCHAKRCMRVGRHPVEGTTYVVCAKHHPDDHKTAEEIRSVYEDRN